MGCSCGTTEISETIKPNIKPQIRNEIKEDEDKITVGSDIYNKIKILQ